MRRASRAAVAGIAALAAACGRGSRPETPETPDASSVIIDVAGQVARIDLAGGVYGDPLPGLPAEDQARFTDGRHAFTHDENNNTGLGPVFNGTFCASCHDAPPGGTNQRIERRFGRRNPDGGFDPLTALGGTLLHDHGIGAVPGFNFAGETVPAEANIVAGRRTQPLFGLGLVDATPDTTFQAIAAWQALHSLETAGRAASVVDLGTGKPAVGKFGWKSQVPTLFQFSGDAALHEMGITSPQFPDEVCPGGNCALLAFNPVAAINDPGGRDVRRFADFMLFLGPPPAPRPSADSTRGAQIFAGIGCAACHLPLIVTGPNDKPAFDRVAYHPYSDFLLHDMGSLGDGIAQADARPGEMRTAPLWGLSVQGQMLHDARATTAAAAIEAHDGQGARARAAFAALGDADRASLVAFLESL